MIKERVYTVFRELFYVDLRSLAVLRIGVAVAIILDLIFRSTSLILFYTDKGIFPRNVMSSIRGVWPWSIHALSGSWQFELLLFIVAVFFGALLLIGYKTRAVTIVSFILLLSLQHRVPMISYGGDVLLRLLVFWGIFLPWGARFSVDSIKNNSFAKLPNRVFTLGIFCYLMQVCFVYFFAGLLKSGPAWVQNFNAAYYVFKSPLATPIAGIIIKNFFSIIPIITFLVRSFEVFSPFLLFFPIRNPYVRLVTIIGLIIMHISFGLGLYIGLFPLIDIVALLGFIPSLVWDSFYKPVSKSDKSIDSAQTQRLIDVNPVFNILAVIFLVYVFIWNIDTVKNVIKIPTSPGIFLGLSQNWKMFAPSPVVNIWEIQLKVKLDNRKVVTLAGPFSTYDMHVNYLWTSLFLVAPVKTQNVIHLNYARFLCHDPGTVKKYGKITEINVLLVSHKTLLPGESEVSPRIITLGDVKCK